MQRIVSKKTLRAKTPAEMSYRSHSATMRYSRRFKPNKSRYAAQRIHARLQRQQARELLPQWDDRHYAIGAMSGNRYCWYSLKEQHLKRHNPSHQAMLAQQSDREARRLAREAEERQQERTVGALSAVRALVQQSVIPASIEIKLDS